MATTIEWFNGVYLDNIKWADGVLLSRSLATIQVSSYSISEDGGSVDITITRSGPHDDILYVNYKTTNGTATAGEDYTGVVGTLTWGAGEWGDKIVTIPITNDTDVEDDETFLFTLYDIHGQAEYGIREAEVTILNDDSYPDRSGIFLFGQNQAGSVTDYSTLVSNTGVLASDVINTGKTGRTVPGACGYGADKGICAFGSNSGGYNNLSNLISELGVVGNDVSGVGTAREYPIGCRYGVDTGVFAYGHNGSGGLAIKNLVSNTGVIASDVSTSGSGRTQGAGCSYGGDKGIFAYGLSYQNTPGTALQTSALISNTGAFTVDQSIVGTARYMLLACNYGLDKGLFNYGYVHPNYVSTQNLVSNQGVIASDTTSAGSARGGGAACGYGTDKGIIGFGATNSGSLTATNTISNTGVVGSDTANVGNIQRHNSTATSFGS